jgi:tetratricopeptide (TPR) repeat protein
MMIALETNDDGAVFRYPSGYADVVDEFDDLLDRREAGRLDEHRYLRTLEDLVVRHPWFIDGHAHIGNSLYDRREFERALEAYERGYSLGTAVLPAGFDERIAWRHLGNRPFLRAAHGVALSRLRLGRRGEGISTMEKMLGWNPDDHQGIRLVIGSEYLRAGEDERAMSFFETETGYPPYRYEMALLLLCLGLHVEAATSLRCGFVENGYIAEVLCGNPHPLPAGIWHGTAWAEPRLAMEYVLDYGMLWHLTPDAVAFLRWLHTHPKVMAERAGILQWQEALLWERDAARRASIGDKADAAWERIDDRLSEEIVVERTDRHGRTVLPWLHSSSPAPGRTAE